jgi:hypothetical protein
MHKIENKKMTKKGIAFVTFLAFFLSYTYNFIVFVFDLFFPMLVFLLMPSIGILISFLLFNNYFSNDYKASLVKTLFLFIFLNILQLTSMILFPVFNLFMSYEELSSILGFIAQGWSVIVIALFYNKVRPFLDQSIEFLYKRFDLVVFGLLYILSVTVIFKLGLRFLVKSTLSLIIVVIIFGIGFLGVGYLIYRYSPKNKIKQ